MIIMNKQGIYKGELWFKPDLKTVSGKINCINNLQAQNILVIDYILPVHYILIYKKQPIAIIVGKGNMLSHATIIARELKIPLIFQSSFVKNFENKKNIEIKIDFIDNWGYIFVNQSKIIYHK